MEHYDLCVIGGGPAGYAAAMRAIDLGMRTLLVERDRIGGTGIYNGALTSKTLWEISQRVAAVNEMVRPRGREPFRMTWEEVSRTLNEAVFERKYLYACHLQLLQNNGTDQFRHERGTARFIDPHRIRIERPGCTVDVTSARTIVATGSRPRTLPGVPVDERRIMTSDGIFALEDLPESLVIIGAGVIGCEFATILSNFGRTRVHLIDRAARILPFEDEDVSELVASNRERKGVIVHREVSLEHLEHLPDAVRFSLKGKDGKVVAHEAERALLSVGRVPNLEGLGLDLAGVQQDPATGRVVLEGTRTNVPHIHVVGDATGSNMLVNLGELAGRHAVEELGGLPLEAMETNGSSTIMFLDPEVAGVGVNEQQCRQRNIPHRVARIDYACLARAIAMRRTQGFFKLIVSDDREMRVLGMRAVGEHASSAIQAVALMMHLGVGVRTLTKLVHPHPSITEGVQECARMLLNESIFKSPVFGDKMRCHTWRPGQADTRAA